MNKFIILFRQSMRAILANKGRSTLTVLGIVIGIASVIALISLGNGANKMISDQISQLGSTNLTVIPGGGFGSQEGFNRNPTTASSLTTKDLESLQNINSHPTFNSITGVITAASIVGNGGSQRQATVNGVSSEYFNIFSLKINAGNQFDQLAVIARQSTVMLGSKIATDIFGNANPLNQTITLNQRSFQVVGVLAEAPENRFNDSNIQLFIPVTTAADIFGVNNLSSIVVRVKTEGDIDAAKADIQRTLLASHNVTDEKLADFSILSSADLLSTINQITGLLTSLLAGIAGISLVVGGIGIMNIMLVAVTERTREIGLRKAVGAKTSDILIQFLIEAVLLTIIGGIIGIALGYGAGLVVAKFIDLTPVVTLNSLLLAVGVSSIIGIAFGIYPAAKAAKLNPIDALRYE